MRRSWDAPNTADSLCRIPFPNPLFPFLFRPLREAADAARGGAMRAVLLQARVWAQWRQLVSESRQAQERERAVDSLAARSITRRCDAAVVVGVDGWEEPSPPLALILTCSPFPPP